MRRAALLAGIIPLALAANFASAYVLTPGFSSQVTLTTVTSAPAGTVLATESTPVNLEYISGTLTSEVIQGTNGDLTFYYDLSDVSTTADYGSVTAQNFGTYSTDLNVVTNPDTETASFGLSRSADGNVVGAAYGNSVATPSIARLAQTSADVTVSGIYITTDATNYDNNGTLTIDANIITPVETNDAAALNPDGSYTVFEPTAPQIISSVPLPAGGWMALIGLSGVIALGARRRQAV